MILSLRGQHCPKGWGLTNNRASGLRQRSVGAVPILAFLVLFAGLGRPDPETPVAKAARIGKGATALVECDSPRGKSHGTAFCIHPAGLFVTNAMTVSATDQVRWDVPPDFAEAAVPVVVSIRAAPGQEVFHRFMLRTAPSKPPKMPCRRPNTPHPLGPASRGDFSREDGTRIVSWGYKGTIRHTDAG